MYSPVAHDRADGVFLVPVGVGHSLADDIRCTEQQACGFLSNGDTAVCLTGGAEETLVTVQRPDVQHTQGGSVGLEHRKLQHPVVFYNKECPHLEQAVVLYLRIVFFQVTAQRLGRVTCGRASETVIVHPDQIQTVGIAVKTVISHLVVHPEGRKGKAGQAHSQSQDADDALCAVFQQVAPGDFQVV